MNTQTTPRIVRPGELAEGLFSFLSGQIHVIDNSPRNKLRLIANHRAISDEITEIKRIVKEDKFLPIEDGKTQYEALLPDLYNQEQHLRMAIWGYPRWMNLDFLTWPQAPEEGGWPAFMVLDPWNKQRTFEIKVKSKQNWGDGYSVYFQPYNLPSVIKDLYKDFTVRLCDLTFQQHATEASITATYSGLIPNETKNKIQRAKASKIFTKILIIAESPKFKLNFVVRSSDDPLVVGVVESNDINNVLTQFYLIDDYSPTDIEKCVRDQFSFDA